jgi:hypothetical protein
MHVADSKKIALCHVTMIAARRPDRRAASTHIAQRMNHHHKLEWLVVREQKDKLSGKLFSSHPPFLTIVRM